MAYEETCIWRDPELYVSQLCPENIHRLVQYRLRRPEIPACDIIKMFEYSQNERLPYGFLRHIWSPRSFLKLEHRSPMSRIQASKEDIWELGQTIKGIAQRDMRRGGEETQKSSFTVLLDAYIKSLLQK